MGFKRPPKSWLIYTIPMVVAALARIIFFFQWLDSPFRYYHVLYGLDMRKFLAWGEVFYSKKLPFSMYKFFVSTIYLISGKEYLPIAVVIAQMILGVLVAGLTVYVFRHLFRKKAFAMIAGLFSASYAPFLIYETQILKETLFLFLCFLALAAVITLRRKKFSFLNSFITGIIITAPFFLRFSGLLLGICMLGWIFLYLGLGKKLRKDLNVRKNLALSLKPLIPFLLGVLCLFCIISGYNWKNGRTNYHYFNPNSTYLLGVGKTPDIRSLSFSDNKEAKLDQSGNNLVGYTVHYLKKGGYIFSAYEQPNNVNYYFIKNKIPFLNDLTGPMVFIPLGISGLILLLINFRKNSRISILLFYMLAIIIPMFLFVPLARYKIILAPIYSIFGAYWISYVFSGIQNRKRNMLVNALLIFFLVLIFSVYCCRDIPRKRQSDIQAMGMAAAFVPDRLMQEGKFNEAYEILEKHYSGNEDNPYIMLRYVYSLLATGRVKEAYFILKRPRLLKDPGHIGAYFFALAECSYIMEKKKEALDYYDNAVKYPIPEHRKKRAIKRIQEILRDKK